MSFRKVSNEDWKWICKWKDVVFFILPFFCHFTLSSTSPLCSAAFSLCCLNLALKWAPFKAVFRKWVISQDSAGCASPDSWQWEITLNKRWCIKWVHRPLIVEFYYLFFIKQSPQICYNLTDLRRMLSRNTSRIRLWLPVNGVLHH